MDDSLPSAGDLRHRVKWQRLVTGTRDQMNIPIESWETIATLWADVRPISGKLQFVAQQLQATTTHRIALRGGRDVRPSDRFLFGTTTRALHVDSAYRVDEQNAWTIVMATEKTL
jgi:SPP1 family predicted phage head-tail adaptor